MARLKKDSVGCHAKLVFVDVSQRLDHRGHEVGATANGFRDDDVRPIGTQFTDFFDQVVELAAKTGSRHFLDGETLSLQTFGVDQIVGLIVGNKTDVQALRPIKTAGEPSHRGRLAGTEKSTDKNKSKLGHRKFPLSHGLRSGVNQSFPIAEWIRDHTVGCVLVNRHPRKLSAIFISRVGFGNAMPSASA